MARILIAGCGDVGTALGRVLAAGGAEVFGLRRRTAALPAPLRPVTADLTDPRTLSALPERIDQVVYTAAADGRTEEAYRRAYLDGPRHLLEALDDRRVAVQRFVYCSSTAVYGQTTGEWVDESSATTPPTFAGQILLAGERTVLEAGIPAIVVRLAGIYGPGRTRLVDQVRSGRATCPDGPPVWTNRIHRDDCVGALRHLLALPGAAGIWLAVDDEPAPLCTVLDWLADRLGVPPPRQVPKRSPPEARGDTNKRCRNTKLTASGYRCRFPSFREGYAALLAAGAAPARPPT